MMLLKLIFFVYINVCKIEIKRIYFCLVFDNVVKEIGDKY